MRVSVTITLTLALLFATTGPARAGSVGRPSLHAERPPTQAGMPGTTSSMSITRYFPAGLNHVEFDYFVDSEQNDKLEVYAIGYSTNPIWTASGLNMGGHASAPFSLGGPTLITVKFQYTKNNDAIHGGSDVAWVDRIRFVGTQGGVFYGSSFEQETPNTTPGGWQGGGFDGGWVMRPPAVARSAMRPPGQEHGQKSHMEASFSFPLTSGGVDFDYYVDSEEQHDFLDFYIAGVKADLDPESSGVQGISGPNRRGHVSVAVPTPGQHVLRFEYSKDETGSEGLDMARIDRVRVRLAPAVLEYFHEFSDRIGVSGGIRHKQGGPIEWSGDWVAVRASPHRTYLPLQQAGQKWDPNWATFSVPQVDGLVTSEYRNPVTINLLDYSGAITPDRDGRLFLVADGSALYIGLRVPARSAAAGDEHGRLRLFLDDRHLATMHGSGGCGQGSDLPAPGDRMVDLVYTFSQPLSLVPGQQRGTCEAANPWVPTDTGEPPWNIDVAMSEPAADPGFVHMEIKIQLPPSAPVDHVLGLALIRENIGQTPALERYPYVVDDTGPLADEVSSWESLLFEYHKGHPHLSERAGDLGAFPQPDRPYVHW